MLITANEGPTKGEISLSDCYLSDLIYCRYLDHRMDVIFVKFFNSSKCLLTRLHFIFINFSNRCTGWTGNYDHLNNLEELIINKSRSFLRKFISTRWMKSTILLNLFRFYFKQLLAPSSKKSFHVHVRGELQKKRFKNTKEDKACIIEQKR